MISGYEDWDYRRNWYALAISIMTTRGAGAALYLMGVHGPSTNRKISQAKKDAVIEMRNAGMTYAEIGHRLGINHSYVGNLYRRHMREQENAGGDNND